MKQPKLPSPLNYFLHQLVPVLLVATILLVLAGSAAAQGAPAGPLPPAPPSDKPPEAPKPRVLTIGGKPNLSGTWVLNRDQSDDAGKRVEQARGTSGHGGGRPPVSGGGGIWWPRRYPYPSPKPTGRGQGGSAPADFMEEFSQLTIEQTESTVKVAGQSGQVLAVYPVPERSQPASSAGDAAGSTARTRTPPSVNWQGSRLVVEEERGHGGSTTRTYELSPDGKQLYLTTKLESPRLKKAVTIRFVYDSASSGG